MPALRRGFGKKGITMKKILILLSTFILMLALTACRNNILTPAADYPGKNIHGIVQWGAGGGTDSLMRPLAALAEKELGVSLVVQNMPGASGSIATQYVHDSATDGYTLLMGAENPALYKELEISELTYADFDCVFLIGDETVGIIVNKDSPYNSFTDIIKDALIRPGVVKISTTGKGGLPWEVSSFVKDVTGATFNQIPYDSDASARTAVLNGECDFTVCKVQSGLEEYRAGEIKFLCMLSLTPVPALPDVSLITADYPDFAKYLPWGPFYGVFVKKDTDPAITQNLSQAFTAAAADPGYQELLSYFNINFLGYTGVQAQDYIRTWQSNTVNALNNNGALQ